MEDERKQGQPDPEAVNAMHEQNIALTLSNEKDMNRAELNFYLEFFGLIEKLEKALVTLSNTITTVGYDKLTAYFKELSEEVEKEKTRVAVMEKISRSHKKARKTK